MTTQHIVMYSGGAMSWLTARRVSEQHGTDSLTLLFADTLIEDPTLYDFLTASARGVGGELVRLADGRTPWQVFRDVRFLGNTRVDPCSRVLKRELIRDWLEANHAPAETVIYLGMGWDERDRFETARERWKPWVVEAPLTEPPLEPLSQDAMLGKIRAAGLPVPRLYELGFSHNNCGGFCVKAGHGHFARLLRELPEVYAEHEAQEEALREYLGKDVAILRDRRGGTTKPLTMRQFRERYEDGDRSADDGDEGGCSCFYPLFAD